MLTSIAISPAEHAARCEALLAEAQEAGLSGVVLFDPYYVLYYAGFAFVPTERPIALVLGSDGTRTLVVPRLELEHAESKSTLDRVEHYLEGARLPVRKRRDASFGLMRVAKGRLYVGVARAAAAGIEGTWKLLRRKSRPPLSRFTVWVSALECTINDSRAREELGYREVKSREAFSIGVPCAG